MLAAILASLVFLGPAVASGADVLADYDDNGAIDRCYEPGDFADALDRIASRPDLQQYAAAGSLIQEKAAECSGETIVPGQPPVAEEDDDGATALWVVIGVVVAAAIAAALVVAARRRGSAPRG